MRTTETIYETTGGNFQVRVYDVINSCWLYLGTENSLKDAVDRLRKEQVNYYKDKKYLLPKNIHIDLKEECFIFKLFYNKKRILHKKCDTLENAILEKQNFLLKLL